MQVLPHTRVEELPLNTDIQTSQQHWECLQQYTYAQEHATTTLSSPTHLSETLQTTALFGGHVIGENFSSATVLEFELIVKHTLDRLPRKC